jgi:hypothetical protein
LWPVDGKIEIEISMVTGEEFMRWRRVEREKK